MIFCIRTKRNWIHSKFFCFYFTSINYFFITITAFISRKNCNITNS